MPGRLASREPASVSACTRKRSARSSTIGPYSTSRLSSPCRAGRSPGVGPASLRPTARRDPHERAVFAFDAQRPAQPDRLSAVDAADEPHGVAGPQLAHLPQLGARHDRRADEAAQARPVGAEDDRHVAGEVDRCRSRRRCRGCWTDAGRLAAVGARPLRAWGRSGARRCGRSCSAPPMARRTMLRCRRR